MMYWWKGTGKITGYQVTDQNHVVTFTHQYTINKNNLKKEEKKGKYMGLDNLQIQTCGYYSLSYSTINSHVEWFQYPDTDVSLQKEKRKKIQ